MKPMLRRLRAAALVTASTLAVLALPASASALTLHIANESGRPANQVFVDVASGAIPPVIDVSGFPNNDEAKALSEIPGGNLEIEKLVSGRVYISYGAPVHEGVTTESPVRYDWAELTVTPNPADAANLTAVNQVGIGMQLSTFGPGGEPIESLGSTYSNTLFAALQQIPGGPQSTIRAANGEILRVLSPDNVNSAYPLLTEYVHSMAGQTITLHTPFFKENEDTWSDVSGTFEPDGSIKLVGKKRVESGPEENVEFTMNGPELIADIYSGGNTPNDLEGAIRRDVLAGFSLGLWGGKYGNDAIDFCTDKLVEAHGERCPTFNVPAFAEARTTPPPFAGPAYEQYSSVIEQYTSIYGNPYSDDASKKVQIALDQPQVKTLQLTILPDSPPPPATPSGSAGSGAPAAAPAPPAPTLPLSVAKLKAPKKAEVKKGRIALGNVDCQGACGRVVATLHPARGKAFLLGIEVLKNVPKASSPLVLKPTKSCLGLLKKKGAQQVKLTVMVTQKGRRTATKTAILRLAP